MDFKKYSVVYILIFLVVVLFGLTRVFPNAKLFNISTFVVPTSQPSASAKLEGIKVIVNFGDKTQESENIKAENAYGALVELAKQKNIDVKTKTYDFGIFVESIGGSASGKDMAWIYYVNGVSGDVGADKKIVNNGDMVEWKYEKPIY